MMLGTTGWALGSVLAERGFALAPGATGFATEMLCGGVVLLVISALRGESWLGHVPAVIWLAWLYLVIFGSSPGDVASSRWLKAGASLVKELSPREPLFVYP
jgi:drug/metabolite transporter (DMT)-like permease